MKFLMPTADFPPIEGGIATLALETARALSRLGHEVTVVAPYFPEMESFDRAEAARIIRFRGYRTGWLRLFPMFASTLPRYTWADYILGVNVAYGGVMGWLTTKPYVTFGYGYEFLKFADNPLAGLLLRSVYGGSRCVVAISSFTRNRLQEFGVRKDLIEVILPGGKGQTALPSTTVEQVRAKYDLEGKKVILAVGRFVPRKGQAVLLRALPKILDAHPDAVLILVGRGPTLAAVEAEAGELGVADHVRLPGRAPEVDMDGLYECCNVFALPTGEGDGGQVEGFGIVFAEAQAHGKPVVAGRGGGVAEAVIDGETGLLVDPESPDETAAAICRLLDDSDLAARLGQRGLQRVDEELNWDEFARRLVETLEDSR